MKDERLKSAKINRKRNYYFNNIDNIANVTPIKSVFKPFLSEENIENSKNKIFPEHKKFNDDIVYQFKNQSRRIKELYKIDNTIFNQIIYEKENEKELKENSSRKKSIKKLFDKKKFEGLDDKIFAGTLDYLELDHHNLDLKKLNNIKKDYLLHSSNFHIAQNKSEVRNYKNLLSPSPNKKQYNYLTSSNRKRTLSENLNIEETKRNSIKDNNNNINTNNNSNNTKENDILISPSKTIYSLKKISSYKRPQTGIEIKSKIPIKFLNNSNIFKSRNTGNNMIKSKTIDFNGYDNIYADLYLTKGSIESFQLKKEMRKTKNEIVSKLKKNIERPISKMENQLLRIIDRANKVKNKEILNKNNKDKLKKDIEIITGIKVKLRNKKQKAKKFLLETIKGDFNEKRKKAMLKISDKILNMNDETALKFAEEITTSYFKKTRKGKYFCPKTKKYTNVNFNMDIRKNLVINQKKVYRMTFSLEKLKSKFDL